MHSLTSISTAEERRYKSNIHKQFAEQEKCVCVCVCMRGRERERVGEMAQLERGAKEEMEVWYLLFALYFYSSNETCGFCFTIQYVQCAHMRFGWIFSFFIELSWVSIVGLLCSSSAALLRLISSNKSLKHTARSRSKLNKHMGFNHMQKHRERLAVQTSCKKSTFTSQL